MANIHDGKQGGRQFPSWNMRACVRKTDDQGNILDENAYNGEIVRVSPRYQRHGVNFRVRPERPAAFFAAYCYEQGLLPTLLSPDECQQEWALELLDSLWEDNKFAFAGLESPYAACDQGTTPSHRIGFSFVVLQILVQQLGAVRSVPGKPTFRPTGNGTSSHQDMDAIRRRIEEQRARGAAGTGNGANPGKKKKSYDPNSILAAINKQPKEATEPSEQAEPAVQ